MKRGNASELGAAAADAVDILPEYDFSRARPNKYAALYQKGGLAGALDFEAEKVLPKVADVNDLQSKPPFK